ncbi:peptidoglycan recognition protein family protein [Nonomuraea turcica]|uniref:peptidoglycan recognition protein family protein n=1 Tax=Nonomuraea sp. G32 TaxID=3067274 RepID=UPI00273BF013|nr:peptidoglycan-binding protein [Nonomuraea sp. G32]MDP4501087.1 peptidoglycan-binding protein [Nonomuraea sp. G32]
MRFETRAVVGLPDMSGVSTDITPGAGGVAVHYVGGAVGIGQTTPHTHCRAKVREIHDWHTSGNGWAYFAYSMAVCQHGIVMEGRGTGRRTAANGTNDANQRFYAVLGLIGGNEKPSDAMVAGIRDAISYLRVKGGARKLVTGHRDHYSTDCPGTALYALAKSGALDPAEPEPSWTEKLVKDLPTLGLGDDNYDVKTVRAALFARGHVPDEAYGEPAGLKAWLERTAFDSQLATLVAVFQKAEELDDDGVVGPRTWRRLVRR